MRFHVSLPTITVVILLCLSSAGCPSHKQPPTPREPLPSPTMVRMSIDQQLRAAANREIGVSLKSSDPLVRVHALEAIGDTNSIEHNPDVLQALEDHDPHVRFAGALAAGKLKIAEAHDPLRAIAEDRSENVRVAVRYALHRLGDTELSHQLEKMAVDSNPLVRGNTAFVLGLLGEHSALPILRTLRNDAQVPVRQQASEAMWRLGDEEGLTDLIGMSMSAHPDDQMIAYIALAMPGNTSVRQHVRAGLLGEDSNDVDREKWQLAVPLVAARAMGMLGSDEGYGVAIHGARSGDAQLRTLAALAFGAIGRADAQPVLQKLLTDDDPNVRLAAATGILQLKQPK